MIYRNPLPFAVSTIRDSAYKLHQSGSIFDYFTNLVILSPFYYEYTITPCASVTAFGGTITFLKNIVPPRALVESQMVILYFFDR